MASDKSLDFEINLLPVISLLAVLLSFLLLTATWVQMGGHDLKQALGLEKSTSSKDGVELWVAMKSGGGLQLSIKSNRRSQSISEIQVGSFENAIDRESFEEVLIHIREQFPDLTTALLLPNQATRFEDLISVMDVIKKSQISDVGVAPL